MPKYLLPILLLLVTACQKEVFSIGSDTESIPLLLQAEVLELEVDRRYSLNIEPVPTGDFFNNVGAIGTVFEGTIGTSLMLGLFTQENLSASTQAEQLVLQFWPEDFVTGRGATPAEMSSFFTEGRSFPFGAGPGQVRFDLALEDSVPGERLSSSSFSSDPEGMITVERVFPYQSSIPGLTDAERNVLLIRLSFSGLVGIYDELDFLAAQEDGLPYVAKESAMVEGVTVLALESTWR
ncbi:MAG: hypothetical protein AAF597_09280 [Bacteroidota bacterium]